MKKKWVAAKIIAERFDRIYGFAIRFLRIDVCINVVGWINDWAILDLCMFRSGVCGVYLQVLGLVIYVGHNDILWTPESQ